MNQILYALWTICPGLPHHFDTALRELYCEHEDILILTLHTGNYWGAWGHSQFSCWNIGTEKDIISLEQIMCRGNENIIGQNYKARLECGVEIISLKFTWPLLLPLNWTKINQSTASRHINHPNLTLIKTIWSLPSPAWNSPDWIK